MIALYTVGGVGGGGGGGGGGGVTDDGFDTIVESLVAEPGPEARYVTGLSTIWSIDTPSSRVWTRIVCAPAAANVIMDGCDSQ
jgi:hypothetical protein